MVAVQPAVAHHRDDGIPGLPRLVFTHVLRFLFNMAKAADRRLRCLREGSGRGHTRGDISAFLAASACALLRKKGKFLSARGAAGLWLGYLARAPVD